MITTYLVALSFLAGLCLAFLTAAIVDDLPWGKYLFGFVMASILLTVVIYLEHFSQ